MTSKFAALAANVAETFRVELIDPLTDEAIKDDKGKPAYIDVLSTDSETGRVFDRESRSRIRRSAMKSRTGIPDDVDQLDENVQKCARLTKGWHLVDPATRKAMDVPCTADNAIELYGTPGMNWLYVQVWAGASNPGNFIRRGPKAS